MEEEEPAFDVADGYNVEGRTCKHHENDYKEIMDWEVRSVSPPLS